MGLFVQSIRGIAPSSAAKAVATVFTFPQVKIYIVSTGYVYVSIQSLEYSAVHSFIYFSCPLHAHMHVHSVAESHFTTYSSSVKGLASSSLAKYCFFPPVSSNKSHRLHDIKHIPGLNFVPTIRSASDSHIPLPAQSPHSSWLSAHPNSPTTWGCWSTRIGVSPPMA